MSGRRRRLLEGIGRFVSRISIRLLAFNVLLVFLPAIGILTLKSYERQLLDAQERAMVQQGRLLAAALGNRGGLDGAEAERLLVNLEQRQEYRLRVIAPNGTVVADSSRLGPRRNTEDEGEELGSPEARKRPSYRVGLFFYRLFERLLGTGGAPRADAPAAAGEPAAGDGQVLTPEVRQALAGRYGSAARPSPTSRSLMLSSALPITDREVIVGAVLVSRSTFRILQALYDFRTATVEVILLSLVVAAILSLLVSTTIARPLGRLKRDARALLDRRGRLRRPLEPLARADEIGDLSRALAELTHRLERHQTLLESFASDVSHELKNPLAAIRGVLDVLPEVDDPAEHARFIGMATADVARLEQLITSLRDVALIDSRLDDPGEETVAVASLVRAAIERRALATNGSGPRFVLAAAEPPLLVRASPARLAQVIDNLLDNAAGFAPPGSQVEIDLERDDDAAVLRVRDRGPGFPEGNLARLFDRFFTDRPGSQRGAGGHTGLGLAIVKSIAEGYGGRVSARNRDGGGAEVAVLLPRAERSAQPLP